MDFIERWFHVSPDGGNGSLEALYVAMAVTVVVAFVLRRHVLARLSTLRGRD